jgi:hypothetical protein
MSFAEELIKQQTEYLLRSGYTQLSRNDDWLRDVAVGCFSAKSNPGCQVNITCPTLDLACAIVHLVSRYYNDDIDFELTERGSSTNIEFKNGSCVVFKIEGDPQ